eukprot:3885202-Pleurochrysis_carterae.AAC.2
MALVVPKTDRYCHGVGDVHHASFFRLSKDYAKTAAAKRVSLKFCCSDHHNTCNQLNGMALTYKNYECLQKPRDAKKLTLYKSAGVDNAPNSSQSEL